MASKQFNIAKGRLNEFQRKVVGNDPVNAGYIIVLLQVTESDALLEDRATLAEVLSNNTIADFLNYEDKPLSDSDLSDPTVDNSANTQYAALPLITWTSAGDGLGGANDNTLVRGLVCYAPDLTSIVNANVIPLTFHDIASITTNGNNLNLNAGTFFTAS